MKWHVYDVVTEDRVSKDYDKEDHANSVCYQLNLDAGPGGRFNVRETAEDPPRTWVGWNLGWQIMVTVYPDDTCDVAYRRSAVETWSAPIHLEEAP